MILQSGGITELRRSYKMLTWSSLFHRQIRTIQTSNTNAQRKHFGLVKTQFGSKKNWLPCHKVTCIMQTVVLWRSRMENQASTTVALQDLLREMEQAAERKQEIPSNNNWLEFTCLCLMGRGRAGHWQRVDNLLRCYKVWNSEAFLLMLPHISYFS